MITLKYWCVIITLIKDNDKKIIKVMITGDNEDKDYIAVLVTIIPMMIAIHKENGNMNNWYNSYGDNDYDKMIASIYKGYEHNYKMVLVINVVIRIIIQVRIFVSVTIYIFFSLFILVAGENYFVIQSSDTSSSLHKMYSS